MDVIRSNNEMLTLAEKQLLALIRLAIDSLQTSHDGRELDHCLELNIDWQTIMKLAEKQSVAGIVFAGIKQFGMLIDHQKVPKIGLLMDWFGQAEYIKTLNEEANLRAVEATKLLGELGYRSVILKGQSNMSLYGDLAMLRTPGDIDIWVDDDREELIRLAKEHWKTSNLQFHHVDCEIPDMPSTELHFWPMVLFNYWSDKRLKKIFNEERETSFKNWYSFENNLNKTNNNPASKKSRFAKKIYSDNICILTTRANVMMQLVHIYHHLLFEGIGLRQLLDYYMLLWSIECEDLNIKLREDIKACGLWKFASAISWIMHEIFHLEIDRLIVPPNKKEGMFLLSEIMVGGNFGHYDERYKNVHRNKKWRNFLFITYQNLRLFSHYPGDCLWNVIYRFCQYWWKGKYGQ